jgi:hypothetical protein
MNTIFRDEELHIPNKKHQEQHKDNGYGFYCDLDNDIENDIVEEAIKYNKKTIDDLSYNSEMHKLELKYKLIVDYCLFALFTFSCSMLILQM